MIQSLEVIVSPIIDYAILVCAMYLLSVAFRSIEHGWRNPFVVLQIIVGKDLGRLKRLPVSIIFFVSRRDARTKKLLRNP